MTKRLLELEPTSLFGDEAILTALSGREELSSPFEFMLTIASTNEKLKPEQIVGQPLAVRINRDDADPRYIHGYVNNFWAGNTIMPETGVKAFRMYRVRIVPWIWFMSRASRSFIYLPEKAEKSIQDVLDKLMERVEKYGHVVPELEASNATVLGKRKVEHCVQYRETDFNFLSRTLERYGIYYYFKFASNKHTLVLSDQLNYPNAPEAEVRYPHSSDTRDGEDVISSWEHAYEFVTGKWEQTDYDFIHPSTNLKVSAEKHSSITLKNNAAYEFYDYPGEYVNKDDGEAEAAVRLEAEETRFNTVVGSSHCKTFSPGYCFKLTEHLNCKDEKGKAYLVTSVAHTATQPGPFNTDVQDATYSNSFTCVPRESQFRPSRSTPQPLLSSVQTAVVVGPPGEEIYTDQYGRVKVQFYWDREGKKDENTCCWVRVSQEWAGQGWGGMQIPHIGHEVVIAFLEGDPDRPLIVGRVYNAEQKVPMPLPAEKTRSVLRDYGGNETVMEGAKGKQFIHTQQTCGNEFLIDGGSGQEKIELRDKYGNEVVLDAVEGTIRIYSPTHKSEIVLGRSLNFSTLSNFITSILGDEWNTIKGGKHENIVGITSKLIGGWKQETIIGLETKINMVAKFEMVKAYAVKIKNSKEFSTVKAAKVAIRKDVLATALSTKLAISGIHELGASKINDLGDKIEIHGEQSAEMIAKKAEIQAEIAKLIGKSTTVEATSCKIKAGKTDIGGGAIKITGSPGKSPKSPKKRKKPNASSPEMKKKKAMRLAQKAARRANRGK